MNILASIEPENLLAVFGWNDVKMGTVIDEVSKLASHIIPSLTGVTRVKNKQTRIKQQIEYTQTSEYDKLFSNVSNYLWDQLLILEKKNPRRKNPKSMSASKFSELIETKGGIANTFYVQNDNRDRDIARGSNGYVFLYALFKTSQNQLVGGVLKEMVTSEQGKKKTDMMYEFITHVYLQQLMLRYSFMSVPRLIAVRKTIKTQTDPGKVFAFMEKVQAPFLGDLDGDAILIALAHLMKCLFVLQYKYKFMHRDLHGRNVAYDADTHTIHFIDFGYSCINPESEDLAWQVNQLFYPILYNGHSAMCDNPSIDVCCIVASLSTKHRFLSDMNEEMKEAFTEKLKNKIHIDDRDQASIDLALQYISEQGKQGNLFTQMKGNNWTVGNESEQPHWWVYDMGEVSVPEFYPTAVLVRLLCEIPLQEWTHIRQSFIEMHAKQIFDEMVTESNCRITYEGHDGTIETLTDDEKFKVKFDVGREAILSHDKFNVKKPPSNIYI